MDDAFEAEDKNEDGLLSRPELGRGLKTLGIKLQTEEVKRVFGLVDPAGTKQVDSPVNIIDLRTRVRRAMGSK